MLSCRVLIDGTARGSWNMAVDEALLELVNQTHEPTLRFYQWAPATLSLGYFQAYADRKSHPPSVGCDLVRRRSGGGAIMHDDELTYSLVMPRTHPMAAQPQLLYAAVHQAAAGVLSRLGVTPHLYDGPSIDGPFLCFQRRSPGDLIVAGNKVLGSAQRRGKSAVLQHGSLILRRSAFAPELVGIADLGATVGEFGQLAAKFVEAFLSPLQLARSFGRLSQPELELAKQYESGRFDASVWTQKR